MVQELSADQFQGPPEYYSDSVRIGSNPYGIVFEFGLTTNSPGDARAQAVVRMSPQHALVFYQLIRKHLRLYEANVGKIALPEALYAELDIDGEI
ncbi:MAG TPA: DUF3467 domain-containing protein [Egibacteraceae bacterium]|nr:DUF3467 domain-containing protein [Egibacteraceae bacterium]